MKPLIWLSLLLVNAAAASPECTDISREHHVGAWEEVPSVESIHRRITPDGVIRCAFFPDRQNRLNVLVRYELGSLGGVAYKLYYPDGSATIQGAPDTAFAAPDRYNSWHLACERPGNGSPPRCTLRRRDLSLHKDSAGQQRLTIGEHHREDSEWLVRVDGNWAVTAPARHGFSADQTRKLLAQLSDGKAADTRYFDASLQGPTGRTIELFGFSEALKIMDAVLEQLNAPPPAEGS